MDCIYIYGLDSVLFTSVIIQHVLCYFLDPTAFRACQKNTFPPQAKNTQPIPQRVKPGENNAHDKAEMTEGRSGLCGSCNKAKMKMIIVLDVFDTVHLNSEVWFLIHLHSRFVTSARNSKRPSGKEAGRSSSLILSVVSEWRGWHRCRTWLFCKLGASWEL